jgi:hypothetical protein
MGPVSLQDWQAQNDDTHRSEADTGNTRALRSLESVNAMLLVVSQGVCPEASETATIRTFHKWREIHSSIMASSTTCIFAVWRRMS